MRVAHSRVSIGGAGAWLAVLALLGCQHESTNDTPTPAETSPAASTPVIATSGAAPRDAALPGNAPPQPSASHPYAMGFWSSCADGFRTSDQPQRDVTRLSFLCGPYQGMSRHGRTWFGPVSKDKDGSFDVRLRKGQCGRVFAVARSGLPSFVVTVLDSSGTAVGAGEAFSGFALANRDGAFCVDRTGTYAVRVSAPGGTGLVAAEVWTLPEP